MKRVVTVLFAAACAVAPAAQAAPLDLGRQTYNVLPPGQTGSLPPDAFGTNQLELYDDLTPLFGDVGQGDIRRLFKSARFFAPAGGEVTRPRRGVTIRRDRSFGVPHIRGRRRSDVFFGIGWSTAEDRGLFMETIRYPSRLAIVDPPGLSALDIATSLRSFEPSGQTERFIRNQRRLILAEGREGRRVLKDANAYTAGINAYYRDTNNDAKPWTQVDVLAVTGAPVGA